MDRLLPSLAIALLSSGRGGGEGIGNQAEKLSKEKRKDEGKFLFQCFAFAFHYPNLF